MSVESGVIGFSLVAYYRVTTYMYLLLDVQAIAYYNVPDCNVSKANSLLIPHWLCSLCSCSCSLEELDFCLQ